MHFVDWCLFYQLAPPVTGTAVAGFLLEMVAQGEPIDDIRLTARVIKRYYRDHRVFLDELPIDRALEVASAQFDPTRVLN
jgi:hypothetical protein